MAVNGLHGDGQLSTVVGAIREAGGVADAFTADVTDERQVTELVAAVADRLGPIEVLVVNATGSQAGAGEVQPTHAEAGAVAWRRSWPARTPQRGAPWLS